jgi:hypothetical protein
VFKWDKFSDQPERLKNGKEKKRLSKKNFKNILNMYIFSIPMYIFFLFKMIFLSSKKREINLSDFIGIGINLDKGEEQIEFLEELQLKNINVRFPLWEIDKISEYKNFIKKFKNYKILLTVLQNRENIENLELFEKNIEKVFKIFGDEVEEFQIGNAINRKKWAFFSVHEYLEFYKIAQKVRDAKFKNLKLIGSGVIDFEFCNTIGTLYNKENIKYDGVSSLLYVDRRGSPENRQTIFFNLKTKIDLLSEIVGLSQKSKNRIYITETNYPIEKTEPYTPTSQYEAVSLEKYKFYMIRYLLISIATEKIDRVYWHQLVSAGYGLIDNRTNPYSKYPAFNSFRTVAKLLQNSKFLNFKKRGDFFVAIFENFTAYWLNGDSEKVLQFKEKKEILDVDGYKKFDNFAYVTESPIYVVEENINNSCYI